MATAAGVAKNNGLNLGIGFGAAIRVCRIERSDTTAGVRTATVHRAGVQVITYYRGTDALPICTLIAGRA